MMKTLFRILITSLAIVLVLTISACVFMRQPQFGQAPSGQRLARIQQSPHYKQGQFYNPLPTPTLAPGYTLLGQLYKQAVKKFPDRYPKDSLPIIKTNLVQLPLDQDIVVWFGHSSCFIQVHGKRLLVDPIFSDHASPIPGTVKAFKGNHVYTAADMPEIDYLLISHDHYDHLDYATVKALQPKVKHVICGLGVGAHFERWGYDPAQLLEKDWQEKVVVDSGMTIHVTPSRHKSGRGFKQNNTLWASYLIATPAGKIYISGDTGYGPHFAAIGQQYGPIDLAIMENGQYDSAWHFVHCLPGEVLQATQDLRAKRLLPVHSSKFALANHAWNEPLDRITALDKTIGIPLVTPMMGAIVYLHDTTQQFSQWWK